MVLCCQSSKVGWRHSAACNKRRRRQSVAQCNQATGADTSSSSSGGQSKRCTIVNDFNACAAIVLQSHFNKLGSSILQSMVNARTHQCQADANHIAERAWCTNEFSTSSFTAVCSSTMTCPLQIRCTAALSMAFIAAMALYLRAALELQVWRSRETLFYNSILTLLYKYNVKLCMFEQKVCRSMHADFVALTRLLLSMFGVPALTSSSLCCFAHSLLCLALVAPFLPFG